MALEAMGCITNAEPYSWITSGFRAHPFVVLFALVVVLGGATMAASARLAPSSTGIAAFAAAMPSSAGGPARLSWSTANALSCHVAAWPPPAPPPVTVPCSDRGATVVLPANFSSLPRPYTFTLTATSPSRSASSTKAHTAVPGFVPPPVPVSTATEESPDRPARLGPGVTLGVTFDHSVTVAPGFSIVLTDGVRKGSIDARNATVAVSAGGTAVRFALTGAPHMSVGSSLSGANLEILGQSGVADPAGPWNLLMSGETTIVPTGSPPRCVPVHSRVFGGTNCDLLAPTGLGAHNFDVLSRPTYDLPGPPNDRAPEVIIECNPGSTDTVQDLATEAPLGRTPCGTVWNEAAIGNTTSNTLNYIPTPGLGDFEQVAVTETVPGSLYVSSSALAPQITAASRSANSVTFTMSTPVTCPDPASLTADERFREAAQFLWYRRDGGSYTNHHASRVTCPGPEGGTEIIAYWSDPSIGLPPPKGRVLFKFEGFGLGPTSHALLVPTGGSSSPLGGEREASQSFETTLR